MGGWEKVNQEWRERGECVCVGGGGARERERKRDNIFFVSFLNVLVNN